MFNKLKDNRTINLIVLFSQLMAERGRSNYFRDLLEEKYKYGTFRIDPDDYSLSVFQIDERDRTSDTSYTFFQPILDSELNESDDIFKTMQFPPRYSEKCDQWNNYINEFEDIKISLNASEKKNIDLKEKIQEGYESIAKLEESNEMLKDMTFALEKKISIKDNEILTLKNELNNHQSKIDKLKKYQEIINEEAIEEKNHIINQLNSTVQNLNNKIHSFEKTIKSLKNSENNKNKELIDTIEKFQSEKKTLFEQIKSLNFELNRLRDKCIEYEEKMIIQKEEYETKKNEIITKLKWEKDELSRQLKDYFEK